MIFRRKQAEKEKVSKMVLDFAGDFIAMGEDILEKQEYLNAAASAWNIACLEENDREHAIKKYMAEYRKMNPEQSKKDFRDTEENLRLLIKQKEKYYPEVRIQIFDARIREIHGKNHVTVASLSIK
jgi:hypothetical protein